jgi:hypothetical protein
VEYPDESRRDRGEVGWHRELLDDRLPPLSRIAFCMMAIAVFICLMWGVEARLFGAVGGVLALQPAKRAYSLLAPVIANMSWGVWVSIRGGEIDSSLGPVLKWRAKAVNRCVSVLDLGEADDLSKLPAYGFYQRSELETVVWPSSLREIGVQCFFGCGLRIVDLRRTRLMALWDGAFVQCHLLREVLLPWTVVYLADDCFSGCVLDLVEMYPLPWGAWAPECFQAGLRKLIWRGCHGPVAMGDEALSGCVGLGRGLARPLSPMV